VSKSGERQKAESRKQKAMQERIAIRPYEIFKMFLHNDLDFDLAKIFFLAYRNINQNNPVSLNKS
jgi:hypothetical protein